MKRTQWLGAVLAGVAWMAAAQASMVDVTYLGAGHSSVLQFERFDSRVLMTLAGQLRVDIDGYETIAYCVDKFHAVDSGPMTFEPITTLNRYHEISYLYDVYAAGIDSDEAGAALAASIWECVYEAPENPLSLTEGVYWIDNIFKEAYMQNIIDLGNSMLASLSEMPAGYTSSANLWVLRSPDSQDMIVPIPEPLTLTLLTLGGAGLLVKSRRMFKRWTTL